MASTASRNESGSGASETKEIRLKLMKPGAREPQNLPIDVNLSSTVRELRSQIQEAAPDHPAANSLRLIYNGRQLADDTILKEAFRAGLDSPNPIHLHVVIRPNPNTPTTTAIPARGFFSSQPSSSNTSRSGTPGQQAGQSATPTTPQGRTPNSGNRSHALSPAAALLAQGVHGNAHVISYNRQVTITTTGTIIRSGGSRARDARADGGEGESSGTPLAATDQNMDGAGSAPGSQSTPQTHTFRFTTQAQPSTPNPEVGQENQDQSRRRVNNPFLTPNPPASAFGPFAEEVYGDFGAPMIDRQQPHYFLLQGPDGPGSILLSPYPPTPPAPASTWADILTVPPRMRSPLAPIGSHMAPPPGLNLNENPGAEAATTGNPQQAALGQNQANQPAPNPQAELRNRQVWRPQIVDELNHLARQRQALLQNAANRVHHGVHIRQPAQIPRQNTPFDYFFRLVTWLVGGNLTNERAIEAALNWVFENAWLALKLAFGVYLLGGGRDARRDMFLWTAAAIIFIVQSGIFHAHMRPLIRRLNAMIPDPERLAIPPPEANQRQQQPQPNGMPDPQQLAERLIRQHNNRQNGIWDNIQTSVSIFLASLVPGLGERVGNARAAQEQLEREALERAAQVAEGVQNGDAAGIQNGDAAAGVENGDAPGNQAGEGEQQPLLPEAQNAQGNPDVQALFGF
ncbi:hypothetical protein TWF281_011769 [Arthrobotrys megalospora]